MPHPCTRAGKAAEAAQAERVAAEVAELRAEGLKRNEIARRLKVHPRVVTAAGWMSGRPFDRSTLPDMAELEPLDGELDAAELERQFGLAATGFAQRALDTEDDAYATERYTRAAAMAHDKYIELKTAREAAEADQRHRDKWGDFR